MVTQKIIIASTEIGTGGLGSYLMTLIEGLESRGWDVHLLVTNTRPDHFDEMSKSFACHDMSAVPLSPKKVFRTADIVNSIIPDIILTNNCALMHYAIPLIDPKIKTISVLHSDDSRFYAIGALFPKRVFRWIAPTVGLATRFQRYIDRRLYEKIRVIPHGINRSRFFPKKTQNDGSARQILFVGFLGQSKGADLLPDIFQKVATVISDSFLTIIGDGPLKLHLDTEFRRRGLQKRILMQGVASPDETAKIMRTSHILLLPTNLEGFGMVIVEAMMCGVVPIVSRLTGITDQLVQDGETGLLVTPHDINGFVEAAIRIHRDSELFRAMSAKAQKVAADRFSVGSMIDRYEALFSEPNDNDTGGKRSIPGWYAEAVVQFLNKRLR
jgi:glycosyltransferase involved in cell wall biosynthesis